MNQRKTQTSLELELTNTKKQLAQTEKNLTDIKKSASYKLGRVITFPIRWTLGIPGLLKPITSKIELFTNSNKKELINKGVIFIDKRAINNNIKNLPTLTQGPGRETPRLIISLTSFPERIDDISYNIYSLLNQTTTADKLILWLAEEQFPDKEKCLPEKLLKLQKHGLTIKWCKDLKSYKKLLFSLKEFPNDIIVTADDDIFYPNNWLELLYHSYLKSPEDIHCHRAHRVTLSENGDINSYNAWPKCVTQSEASYMNFCTTGGGVLYPPNSLHSNVFNEELLLELCPTTDDIWFWGMALLKGTKIKVIHNNISELIYINPELEFGLTSGTTLFKTNKTQNDHQMENLANYFSDIKPTLQKWDNLP